MSLRISKTGYLQFGYYIGRHIGDIPDTYLTWILTDFDIDDEEDQQFYDAAIAERVARAKKELGAAQGVVASTLDWNSTVEEEEGCYIVESNQSPEE